jgi:hypothetical protein
MCVLLSGLGCGSPRSKFHNGKRLRLNPTTPAHDLLVPLWGWDSSYGSPVPFEFSRMMLLWLRLG